jgi:DNA helicase HerA-like ATPase
MGFFEDLFVERLKYEESELSDELKILLVFEEAHTRFSDPYSRVASSEPVGFTHMRTLRKQGIGQVYVDQVPSLLPAQLLANTATFVIFRLVNPNDIRRIGDSIGLSPGQREAIASLPNRRAVVFSHLC